MQLCFLSKTKIWFYFCKTSFGQAALIRLGRLLQTRKLTRLQLSRGQVGTPHEGDVLQMMTAANGVDFNDGNGPFHILLALHPKEVSALHRLDSTTIFQKVRKRMRAAGVRVNLTLQLAPEAGSQDSGKTTSVMHATPLRASRALALRHIAHSNGFSMSQAVFLCTPSSVHAKSNTAGGTVLGTLCSDMSQLVEGAQKVVVVPPRHQVWMSQELSEGGAGQVGDKRGVAAYKRLKVSLEPYDEQRVLVLAAADELSQTLQELLQNGKE
jgi:hypothetical protein